MLRWYNSARFSFAHLPDVSKDSSQELEEHEYGNVISPRVGSFESNDWFEGAWTLQGLLAPKAVYFFDRYWRSLGTKDTLSAPIQKATGIEAQYLHSDASKAYIAVKMSWLARRRAKDVDDMAYCMLSLFAINTLVGSGRARAA